MSFWMGMARAAGEAKERKHEVDMFNRKIAAEREMAVFKHGLAMKAGRVSGSRSGRRSGPARGTSKVTLEDHANNLAFLANRTEGVVERGEMSQEEYDHWFLKASLSPNEVKLIITDVTKVEAGEEGRTRNEGLPFVKTYGFISAHLDKPGFREAYRETGDAAAALGEVFGLGLNDVGSTLDIHRGETEYPTDLRLQEAVNEELESRSTLLAHSWLANNNPSAVDYSKVSAGVNDLAAGEYTREAMEVLYRFAPETVARMKANPITWGDLANNGLIKTLEANPKWVPYIPNSEKTDYRPAVVETPPPVVEETEVVSPRGSVAPLRAPVSTPEVPGVGTVPEVSVSTPEVPVVTPADPTVAPPTSSGVYVPQQDIAVERAMANEPIDPSNVAETETIPNNQVFMGTDGKLYVKTNGNVQGL